MSVKNMKENSEEIRNMRLFDDELFKAVFDGNIEATGLMLNILLGKEDIEVESFHGDWEIPSIEGHSVNLYVGAHDSEGRIYAQIRKGNDDSLPQYAAHYSHMMDIRLLAAGGDFSDLVPTYTIFLTENDTFGEGPPRYTFSALEINSGIELGDGLYILFINGENTDVDTPLGQLIHDLKCVSPDDMYFDVLANCVHHFKDTEEGIAHMSDLLNERTQEGNTP